MGGGGGGGVPKLKNAEIMQALLRSKEHIQGI